MFALTCVKAQNALPSRLGNTVQRNVKTAREVVVFPLLRGGDPARSCWWHITEITMEHVHPSPIWVKQMAELQLAKECEAEIRKRLKALAAKQKREADIWKTLAEVADSLQTEVGQP